MAPTTHLKSLQALELAIREGSLKAAANKLGITPAAVGQRIRALEDYLGTDLLVRGRSGLHPTKELSEALPSLNAGFEALDRATDILDFQRVSEVHIVADPDWAELWLEPRLPEFREAHPNILFCVNGAGDVPMRLGSPDLRVEYGPIKNSTPLYTDIFLPVCSPDNVRRIADYDHEYEMEGMPLLHLEAQSDGEKHPGWREWFNTFGLRESGAGRGPHYRHARIALEAVRKDVGFLVCGLSLIEADLEQGDLVLPYDKSKSLAAPHPYHLWIRESAAPRPQLQRFVDWLCVRARETERALSA